MNSIPLLDRIERDLASLDNDGLKRTLPRNNADSEWSIDVSSNSYCALHSITEVLCRAQKLLDGRLEGNGASRLIAERSPLYRHLEHELAKWKSSESALVFNSGYAANVGILQALCTRSTEVFSDKLNHASIIDGIRLSGARLHRYAHCDMADLKKRLQRASGREKLIVTDTVFSMDGDRAPLGDMCDVARHHDALVMVDEAHATGVLGSTLAGLVEEEQCGGSIDISVSTLSKAVGGLGGFFSGSSLLRSWLVNRARSFVYSTGLPHSVLAYDLAAIRWLRANASVGRVLLDRASRFRDSLRYEGFDTGNATTHIVPVIVGDARQASALASYCAKRGIRVPAIRPPTVPRNTARLRFSLHAGLTDEQCARIVEVLRLWRK